MIEIPQITMGHKKAVKTPALPKAPIPLTVRGPRRKTVESRTEFAALLPGTLRRIQGLSQQLQYYAQRGIGAVGYGHGAATLPEVIVYGWLVVHKLRDEVDFSFQSSQLGGRLQFGGMVVDFLITDRLPNIAIRIQGAHWHTGADVDAKDAAQADVLAKQGIVVEDLYEDECYNESILEDRMREIIGIRV